MTFPAAFDDAFISRTGYGDLQADDDAGSTPCAGFDLQLSSKLLDPRAHISHAKAGGLFETTPAHPGSVVSDLES